ncbi:hypothetical protein [Clostridium intestinale]|uniref:hypothetical protein n=1 Tax=Clostridium intestinale TaxID=36845 RepID=UPI002DD62AA5|nr:hypothetical protein [Clostridium intestinale]WRY52755.1 hypothetical protein P8F83_06035 [Clostridium intestinale]
MVKKENLSEKEIVDITKEENEETIEYIGLREDEEIDGEVIKVLISSSYENKVSNNIDDKNLINKSEEKKDLIKRKGKRKTPAVDGEEYNIKRGYHLRKSTVRMLNKLIGMNQNIDIHMNTIVDNAIREAYFRALLMEKNKSI